jgi:hypothetical protein
LPPHVQIWVPPPQDTEQPLAGAKKEPFFFFFFFFLNVLFLLGEEAKIKTTKYSVIVYVLKGQSHEKVGKVRVWGVSIGPN